MLFFSRLEFNQGDGASRNNGGNRSPQNNRDPKRLPPNSKNLLLTLVLIVGFALLLGAYKGVENIKSTDIFIVAIVAIVISRLIQHKLSNSDAGEESRRGVSRQSGEGNSEFDADVEEEREAEAYWRRREEEEAQTGEEAENQPKIADQGRGRSGNDPWARYRSLPKEGNPAAPVPEDAFSSFGGQPSAGFDREELLVGAKILFEKVQGALSGHDLAQVRDFLNPQAASELAEILSAESAPLSRSVLTLDAAIKDISEQGDATTVTVTFDAMLHTGSDDTPHDVEAVWRFSRKDAHDNWRVDTVRG